MVLIQQGGEVREVPDDVWMTIRDFASDGFRSAPKSIKNLARSAGLSVGKLTPNIAETPEQIKQGDYPIFQTPKGTEPQFRDIGEAGEVQLPAGYTPVASTEGGILVKTPEGEFVRLTRDGRIEPDVPYTPAPQTYTPAPEPQQMSGLTKQQVLQQVRESKKIKTNVTIPSNLTRPFSSVFDSPLTGGTINIQTYQREQEMRLAPFRSQIPESFFTTVETSVRRPIEGGLDWLGDVAKQYENIPFVKSITPKVGTFEESIGMFTPVEYGGDVAKKVSWGYELTPTGEKALASTFGAGLGRGVVLFPSTLLGTPKFLYSSITKPISLGQSFYTQFRRAPISSTGEFASTAVIFEAIGRGARNIEYEGGFKTSKGETYRGIGIRFGESGRGRQLIGFKGIKPTVKSPTDIVSVGSQPKTAFGTRIFESNLETILFEPARRFVEGKKVSPALQQEFAGKALPAIREQRGTLTQFLDESPLFKEGTKGLTGSQVRGVFDVGIETGASRFGSSAFVPQLKPSVRRAVGDIEFIYKTSDEGVLQGYGGQFVKAIERRGGKARVSPSDPFVIEAFAGKEWVKAIELKGRGIGAGEQVPSRALGLDLWSSKDFGNIGGMRTALLRGELKRKGAGSLLTEGGALAVKHTGRYKDPVDLFRIVETLKDSRKKPSPKAEAFLKTREKLGIKYDAEPIKFDIDLSAFRGGKSPSPSGLLKLPRTSVSPVRYKSPKKSPRSYRPSVSPSVSPSISPSVSPSPSPYSPYSPSPRPSPSVSPSISPSVSPYAKVSPSVSPSPSPSPSPYSPSPPSYKSPKTPRTPRGLFGIGNVGRDILRRRRKKSFKAKGKPTPSLGGLVLGLSRRGKSAFTTGVGFRGDVANVIGGKKRMPKKKRRMSKRRKKR